MNETYVGDTIKLVMKTSIDISGYEALFIKFRKPTGVTGYFAANLSGSSNQWMECTLGPTDLDVAGEWTFQAYVEELDHNPVLHGKLVNLEVKTPIVVTTP